MRLASQPQTPARGERDTASVSVLLLRPPLALPKQLEENNELHCDLFKHIHRVDGPLVDQLEQDLGDVTKDV